MLNSHRFSVYNTLICNKILLFIYIIEIQNYISLINFNNLNLISLIIYHDILSLKLFIYMNDH